MAELFNKEKQIFTTVINRTVGRGIIKITINSIATIRTARNKLIKKCENIYLILYGMLFIFYYLTPIELIIISGLRPNRPRK